MDIHKPKAAHSVREFLIEIGTIICGILIALGLEQVVEQARTRHETEELDRALKVEVARDIGEAFQTAMVFYCVRSEVALALDRLRRSEDWPGARFPGGPALNATGSSAPILSATPPAPDAERIPDGVPAPAEGPSPGGAAPILLSTPRNTLFSGTWRAAASTTGLLHMDQRRRDRYARMYYLIDQIEETIGEMARARRDLVPLAYPQTLTSQERRSYMQAFARMDALNRGAYTLTGLLVSVAAKGGIQADPKDLQDRAEQLRPRWGHCIKPFVLAKQATLNAEKFEADETRLAGGGE